MSAGCFGAGNGAPSKRFVALDTSFEENTNIVAEVVPLLRGGRRGGVGGGTSSVGSSANELRATRPGPLGDRPDLGGRGGGWSCCCCCCSDGLIEAATAVFSTGRAVARPL